MRKLAFTIALFAGSASAQNVTIPTYIGNWGWQGQAAQQQMVRTLNQNFFSRSVRKASGAEQQDGSTSTDVLSSDAVNEAVQLDFTPSMQRRRANYAGFVERSRRVDPAGADNLAETLRSDPVAMMQPELAKVGLRIDNVADAYAVYWVEAWQAVHGVTGASSRATAQAVREQAAKAIGSTPVFATATPAQKQELAESYLVQALLVGAAKEQASGDRAKLRQVSAAVEKGARAAGFDLRAVTLTEEGFAPAKRTGAADPAPGAEPRALAASGEASSRPGYGFLAAAGGAGLGAAFLMGKAMGRKG